MALVPLSLENTARNRSGDWPFTPVVRLFAGEISDWNGQLFSESEDGPTRTVPLARVFFDYAGTRVRPGDASMRLLRQGPAGLEETTRDLSAEAQVVAALEGLGAVDLSCLDEVTCDAD